MTDTGQKETDYEIAEVPGVDEHDDVASVFGYEDDEGDVWSGRAARQVDQPELMDAGDPREIADVLESSAVTAQRLLISSLRGKYVRGRAYIEPVAQLQPLTSQRRIGLSSFVTVTDSKATEIVDRLKQGRVVTRMGAAPGVGKTSRIPAEIAVGTGLRVCQLELEASIAEDASVRQKRQYNVRGSNRRFPREKGAYLTCMTYSDFFSHATSGGRKRLFADFDVFYFDEAHDSGDEVNLAFQVFAAYSQQHNSLIVASATVSVEESNNVASKRVGDFKQVEVDVRVAFDSGKMFNEYLRDRTQLLLASDADVWYARALYEEHGIDVKILDSGSTSVDVDEAREWLYPQALIPRVVVTVPRYGLGFNLPVSFVITSATKLEYDWTEAGEVVENVVPLTERDVTQQKARTGRGMTVGSGGLVLSGKRSPECDLSHASRVRVYVGLIAASIKPLASQWEDVARLVPQGLSRDVAKQVLSVPLPTMLVLRYLGRDGNIASFFAQAMNIYAEPDHYIVPSKDVYPVGYDKWKTEAYGGYFEGDVSTSLLTARVPFVGCPSLKVFMHALYAIATHRITVPRWRPDSMEDEASGSEDEAPRFKPKMRIVTPRAVVEVARRTSPRLPVDVKWTFDVPVEQQAKRSRRVAKDWASSPNGERAVAELRTALEGGGTIGVITASITSGDDNDVVEVRSPGGSVTVKLSKSLYLQLAAGRILKPESFVVLLRVSATAGLKLVESGLFSNWGPPWIAVYKTCADRQALDAVVIEGLTDILVKFVSKLYDRFRSEVIEVCVSSHVYSSWMERFLNKKPSVTRLVREVRSGKISIAQSDTFIYRVLEIKDYHDRALLMFEKHGFFVPNQITSAQRRLPLRDINRGLQVIDDHVSVQPRNDRRRSGGDY